MQGVPEKTFESLEVGVSRLVERVRSKLLPAVLQGLQIDSEEGNPPGSNHAYFQAHRECLERAITRVKELCVGHVAKDMREVRGMLENAHANLRKDEEALQLLMDSAASRRLRREKAWEGVEEGLEILRALALEMEQRLQQEKRAQKQAKIRAAEELAAARMVAQERAKVVAETHENDLAIKDWEEELLQTQLDRARIGAVFRERQLKVKLHTEEASRLRETHTLQDQLQVHVQRMVDAERRNAELAEDHVRAERLLCDQVRAAETALRAQKVKCARLEERGLAAARRQAARTHHRLQQLHLALAFNGWWMYLTGVKDLRQAERDTRAQVLMEVEEQRAAETARVDEVEHRWTEERQRADELGTQLQLAKAEVKGLQQRLAQQDMHRHSSDKMTLHERLVAPSGSAGKSSHRASPSPVREDTRVPASPTGRGANAEKMSQVVSNDEAEVAAQPARGGVLTEPSGPSRGAPGREVQFRLGSDPETAARIAAESVGEPDKKPQGMTERNPVKALAASLDWILSTPNEPVPPIIGCPRGRSMFRISNAEGIDVDVDILRPPGSSQEISAGGVPDAKLPSMDNIFNEDEDDGEVEAACDSSRRSSSPARQSTSHSPTQPAHGLGNAALRTSFDSYQAWSGALDPGSSEAYNTPWSYLQSTNRFRPRQFVLSEERRSLREPLR